MNHIKLMVDWNFGQSYVDALNRIGTVKARLITDCGFTMRAKDCDLVCATLDQDCILLTRDKNSINEKTYRPCTHGGIIIIEKARPFVEEVSAWVGAFCRSGRRALAAHAVTHLSKDGAVIYTHGERVEVSF